MAKQGAAGVPTIDIKELLPLRRIAGGEFSDVYFTNWRDKPVAVKRLREDKVSDVRARDDFVREITILDKLRGNGGFVDIYASGSDGQKLFMVLERLGETLANRMKRRRVPLLECVSNGLQLANALDFLHRKALLGTCVLHRDIKPSNIMFTLDGRLRLADFGLVKAVKTQTMRQSCHTRGSIFKLDAENAAELAKFDSTDPMEGEEDPLDDLLDLTGRTGSLRYMAPEVAACHPYNHKSEVYSWAIVFWEMCSNRRPYEGVTAKTYATEVIQKRGRPDMRYCVGWPDELKELVGQCWHHDISIRPPLADVIRLLTNIQERMAVLNVHSGACICGCSVS